MKPGPDVGRGLSEKALERARTNLATARAVYEQAEAVFLKTIRQPFVSPAYEDQARAAYYEARDAFNAATRRLHREL